MPRTLLLLAILGFYPAWAHAQTPDRANWDMAGTVALIESNPHLRQSDGGQAATFWGDDWYADGRYALAIGRYWTTHLKTEAEYAISGEGSTYGFVYPSSVETRHRLEQLSARMVWQFGENQWVHPYVSGGLVGDRQRNIVRIPAQYQYPPGRTSGPMILIPESTSEPDWDYRLGFTAGAGAKIYLSQKAFFHTGFMSTYSKASATLSLLAGFGIDF